jgi:hypothetical protein
LQGSKYNESVGVTFVVDTCYPLPKTLDDKAQRSKTVLHLLEMLSSLLPTNPTAMSVR